MPGRFVQEEEDEEDSEDEEEFVRNSMPGPGSYDCCNSDFDKPGTRDRPMSASSAKIVDLATGLKAKGFGRFPKMRRKASL